MPIESHPERTLVARLADDPQFTADLDQLLEPDAPRADWVLLDFSTVRYINSSNLARLLRLRKILIEKDARLVVAGLRPQVNSVFLTTGLDKIFRFADSLDAAMALTRP